MGKGTLYEIIGKIGWSNGKAVVGCKRFRLGGRLLVNDK